MSRHLLVKISVRHKVFLIATVLLLGTGLTNYYFFQPQILLFQPLTISAAAQSNTPSFFLSGYFSDLVWCTALYLCVVVLAERKMLTFYGRIALILLPFFTEAFQYMGIMGGTGDHFDLLLYSLLVLGFKLYFPHQFFTITHKNKIVRRLYPASIIAFFLMMAVASTAPKQSYKTQPRPCVTHKGITTSPLSIKVDISGSYTMKNLSGAQVSGRDYLLSSLNAVSPYSYVLADGVKPYLTFSIIINESGSYYGAEVTMYVSDNLCSYNGKKSCCCDVFSRFEINYVTTEKLYADIAAKFNGFVKYGWCTNCPSPCSPL